MIRSRKSIFLVFLIFFSFAITSAERENKVRKFDAKEMAAYADSEDFQYMNLTIQPPSIWQRIQWWFADLIARIFSNPNTPWLSDVLFYLILFLVLGVAVFYMLRLKYGGVPSRESRFFAPSIHSTNAGEKIDFDRLIEEARNERNYKLGIRYLFLKTLSHLATKEAIRLKDWKSPYDYQHELKGEVVQPYLTLTRLFEYVWYGEASVSDKEFAEGEKLVSTIQQHIQ